MKSAFLLILPILLILTSIYLDDARGPFWLGVNFDPEYVYLLNSLNLAQWQGVGHIDHPGTPVQVLGAVTLRVLHFFNATEGTDLQTHVLTQPEFYLNAINSVLVSLNVLALLILGAGTVLITRSIWTGLWLQTAVFFSALSLQFGLTRITPEPLLLFSSTAMVLWIIYYVYKRQRAVEQDQGLSIPILLASLISGFGIAVKITFIPLMVVPLLLIPRIRNKIYYLAATIVGFVLFTLPIIRMYPRFFGWIKDLLTHSGQYGSGPSGLISTGKYIKNMSRLLADSPFFATVLILASIILGISFLVPKFRKISLTNTFFKGLAAVTAAQVIGLLMVSKHSAGHYLLPVLNLTGVCLLLASLHLYHTISHFKSQIKTGIKPVHWYSFTAVWLLAAVILFYPPGQISRTEKRLNGIKNQSLALWEIVQVQFSDYAKIYYYRSSAPEYGLKFGSDLSRSYHAEALQKLYNNVYFYDIWTHRFTTFDYNNTIKIKDLRAKYGEKIIIIGTRGVKIPGLRLTEIHHSNSEGVFFIQ